MKKLGKILNLVNQMGWKPIAYRAVHEVKKRTGLLKKSFPVSYTLVPFIKLTEWQKSAPPFFFPSKEGLGTFPLNDKSLLERAFLQLKNGQVKFFNGQSLALGNDYDWITNPDTGFRYNIQKHWTELETLDAQAGDIKFVWEKSRFSFLYTLIRYDHHFKEDQSEFVFSEILSWIEKNPLNMGPNFSCSQEISIRLLNWTFALYYYKNAPSLTEERFLKIINSIYWQARHVEEHIRFSLLSVRNNHAITESLLLYITGLLYPFFDRSKQWKADGKKFLEQEGLYQIYEDGSYLQFSMNYQRVVIQLFTWAFYIAKANGDTFSATLYERVRKAVLFLYQHQDEQSGMLPNYGANDGALFFPLSNAPFRDYRPQLNALYYFFTENTLYPNGDWNEDLFWFTNKNSFEATPLQRGSSAFRKGGYFVMREPDRFCFIRCGSHKDRPSQADNLHLDLWVNGENILRDAGSYKYNASQEETRYFMGTASHNTVMAEDYDQMEKGGRFLWFYWSKMVEANMEDKGDHQLFSGKIHAFRHLKENIFHTRTVRQYKHEMKWEIEDHVENCDLPIKQIWNPGPEFSAQGFSITCMDKNGNTLQPLLKEAFYSPTYGIKERSGQIIFETCTNYFKTIISRQGS